ncbi:hypothetical protein [Streptomyces sp. NPDC018947]|uniref:hypothetical protein n=1 Tax=Streptomyces sp. NPDC018947 TaxID=3365054 RepID=UPI00379FB9B1
MGTADTDGTAGTGSGGARTPRDADRAEKWSIAWILLALALWGCLAVLLLSSYGPEYDGVPRCEGPLVDPFQRADGVCDSELRQWPALLGVLALSTIASVVAAATTVYARLLSRLARMSGHPKPIAGTGADTA